MECEEYKEKVDDALLGIVLAIIGLLFMIYAWSQASSEDYLFYLMGIIIFTGMLIFSKIYIIYNYNRYRQCKFKEEIKKAVKEAIRGED